jgi:hypothetical protein
VRAGGWAAFGPVMELLLWLAEPRQLEHRSLSNSVPSRTTF